MTGDWRTRLWDRVRRRHRCQWHGTHGEPPCEQVLDRDDPPVCDNHTTLPNSQQEFWRKPRRPKTSTEETQ